MGMLTFDERRARSPATPTREQLPAVTVGIRRKVESKDGVTEEVVRVSTPSGKGYGLRGRIGRSIGHDADIMYYYDEKNDITYYPGDAVYLDSGRQEQPYFISGIKEFKVSKRDSLMVSVKWFFRPSEVPESVYQLLAHDRNVENGTELFIKDALIRSRELFTSEAGDTFPVTALRGRCKVHHYSDISGVRDFVPHPDNFFCLLAFNPATKRLATTQGEIRVGASHQARLPICQPNLQPDEMPEQCHHREEIRWRPSSVMDGDLIMYLRAARSMAAFAGMCDGGSTEDGCQAASMDETTMNAMDMLHHNSYDTGKALQALVKCPVPRGIEKKWTDEDSKRFVKGLRQYGKNFFKIRKELLPNKETGELVEYYYFWKKTPAAANNRPHRRHRRQNAFKRQARNSRPASSDFLDLSSASEVSDNDSDDSDNRDLSGYACRRCFTTSSKDWHHAGKDRALLCTACRLHFKRYGQDRPIDNPGEPPPFMFKPVPEEETMNGSRSMRPRPRREGSIGKTRPRREAPPASSPDNLDSPLTSLSGKDSLRKSPSTVSTCSSSSTDKSEKKSNKRAKEIASRTRKRQENSDIDEKTDKKKKTQERPDSPVESFSDSSSVCGNDNDNDENENDGDVENNQDDISSSSSAAPSPVNEVPDYKAPPHLVNSNPPSPEEPSTDQEEQEIKPEPVEEPIPTETPPSLIPQVPPPPPLTSQLPAEPTPVQDEPTVLPLPVNSAPVPQVEPPVEPAVPERQQAPSPAPKTLPDTPLLSVPLIPTDLSRPLAESTPVPVFPQGDSHQGAPPEHPRHPPVGVDSEECEPSSMPYGVAPLPLSQSMLPASSHSQVIHIPPEPERPMIKQEPLSPREPRPRSRSRSPVQLGSRPQSRSGTPRSDRESSPEPDRGPTPEPRIVNEECHKSQTAIFIKHIYRGYNSCARCDLYFKPLPDSRLASKRDDQEKRSSSAAPYQPPPPAVKEERREEKQEEEKNPKKPVTPPENSTADAQITSSLMSHATPYAERMTPRGPLYPPHDPTPALRQLSEYARPHVSGAADPARSLPYNLPPHLDPLAHYRMAAMAGMYPPGSRERLELELARDKQERDARERELRERELREMEFREKIKQEYELKGLGLERFPHPGGLDPHWLELQRRYGAPGGPHPGPPGGPIPYPGSHIPGVYPPNSLTSDLMARERERMERLGVPAGLPGMHYALLDGASERLSAERIQAERLALAADPMLRLQMGLGVSSGGGSGGSGNNIQGPHAHTHTHSHSHTHLHLHQPESGNVPPGHPLGPAGSGGGPPHLPGPLHLPPHHPGADPIAAASAAAAAAAVAGVGGNPGSLPHGLPPHLPPGASALLAAREQELLQRDLLNRYPGGDPALAQQLSAQAAHHEAIQRQLAIERERLGGHLPH